jgi:DNA-binding transcriptional ArsR family regulator
MDKSDAVEALGALAQETRLEIFRLLVQAGDHGMAAGQIGVRLKLPPATLSFHLNQLRHAGLISYRRESRSLIYAAEYAAMNSLIGYLTENCCQGSGTCDVTAPATRLKRTNTGKRVRNHEAHARARARRR